MMKNLILISCVVAAYAGFAANTVTKPTGETPQARQRKDRQVILRVARNNEGVAWEATFLSMSEVADQVQTRPGDAKLMGKIKSWGAKVIAVESSPDVASEDVEGTLLALWDAGIEKVQVVGPYILSRGKIYYEASVETGVSEPDVAVDKDLLRKFVRANSLSKGVYRWPDGRKTLLLQFLIDENGALVETRCPGTPLSPKLQTQISDLIKISAPAHRGAKTVAGVASLSLNLP